MRISIRFIRLLVSNYCKNNFLTSTNQAEYQYLHLGKILIILCSVLIFVSPQSKSLAMNKTENKSKLLELLNAQMSYTLFRSDKTTLSIIDLPFYKEYKLVKAKTFSTIPVVEFSFLWSEKENSVIKISGDRECFFDNIDRLQPDITPRTAVAYIKFVLGNVWDDNGAMRVCESIKEVDFSSSPFPNQLSFLSDNIKPATVSECGDVIVVNCNIVYGKALYKARIELQRKGLFEIEDEEQLGEEIEALRPIFLE